MARQQDLANRFWRVSPLAGWWHCDFDEMVHVPSHTWLLLRLLGPRSYLTASPTNSAHDFPVCVPKAVPASIYMFLSFLLFLS